MEKLLHVPVWGSNYAMQGVDCGGHENVLFRFLLWWGLIASLSPLHCLCTFVKNEMYIYMFGPKVTFYIIK